MMNLYSRTWFDAFLDQIPAEVTDTEVTFLQRVLPLPDYRHVLDLCCGSGRHAMPLTAAGYAVTGVDRDVVSLRYAEEKLRGTEACFIHGDIRSLSYLPSSFDAVLIMWQSFGYFDPDANLQVLHQVADALRPGGRLVLDLYHRAFFEAHSGTRMLRGHGRDIKETKWMDRNRLHVALDYGGDESCDGVLSGTDSR